MKGFYFVLTILTAMAFGACCSKKGACPAIKFDSFELINFSYDEVKDSVSFIRYEGGSNFTAVKDSSYVKVETTDDSKVFRIATGELTADDDYAIRVVKLNKLYRIGNFTVEKIACGKCFMRPNNQFGFQLNGYSVNNRHYTYEDIVRIMK